jgi:hypothetical protein
MTDSENPDSDTDDLTHRSPDGPTGLLLSNHQPTLTWLAAGQGVFSLGLELVQNLTETVGENAEALFSADGWDELADAVRETAIETVEEGAEDIGQAMNPQYLQFAAASLLDRLEAITRSYRDITLNESSPREYLVVLVSDLRASYTQAVADFVSDFVRTTAATSVRSLD